MVDPIFLPILRAIAPEGSVYRGTGQELRESLGFKTRTIDTEEALDTHDCRAEDGCEVCRSILKENLPGYDQWHENEENRATGN